MKTLCVFADGSTEVHEIDPAAQHFVCPRRAVAITDLPGFWQFGTLGDPIACTTLSRFYVRWDRVAFAFFAEGDAALPHLYRQTEAVHALAALISGLRGTLVG